MIKLLEVSTHLLCHFEQHQIYSFYLFLIFIINLFRHFLNLHSFFYKIKYIKNPPKIKGLISFMY